MGQIFKLVLTFQLGTQIDFVDIMVLTVVFVAAFGFYKWAKRKFS